VQGDEPLFVSVILGGFGNTVGPQMEITGEQVAIDAEGVVWPTSQRSMSAQASISG